MERKRKRRNLSFNELLVLLNNLPEIFIDDESLLNSLTLKEEKIFFNHLQSLINNTRANLRIGNNYYIVYQDTSPEFYIQNNINEYRRKILILKMIQDYFTNKIIFN